MKQALLPWLLLFIILSNSCTVLKKHQADTSKWSVATIVRPKSKAHPEGLSKATPHHFSGIVFPADSAGHHIIVREDYDGKGNSFLYFHAKPGDRFSVQYDSLNPHLCKVYSNRPRIDEALADTTPGKISKVYALDGYVEYAYAPAAGDTTKRPALIHRLQDVRSDSLKNHFADLKKDATYPVVFNRTDATKSYMLIPGNTALIPFQDPGTHRVHRAGSRSSRPHQNRIYHEKSLTPLSMFMSVNILPIESLRVGYSILLFDRFAAGIDASYLYKHQTAQKGETNGKSLGMIYYPQPYFSLDKNLYIFNPYVKCYLYRQPGQPGAGIYIRAGYIFTSTVAGLRSDYYNRQGIPLDTSAAGFVKMDPANNKVLTGTSTFKTNGFTLSLGGSIHMSKHWMADLGLGFNYLQLPAVVTQPKVLNNETYYYHISPLWRNPINFPMFIQTSIMYKF